MGTSQFMLVVLGCIIVVIAVAVAIPYFMSYQEEANIDEVTNELNDISSAARGWYLKPSSMGGGNHSFTGFTLASILHPDSTELASYSVIYADGDSLALEAVSSPSLTSAFTVDVNVRPNSSGTCHVTRGNPKGQGNGNGNGNGNRNGNGNGKGNGNGNGNVEGNAEGG
jgi:Tfp pilus assembly major pilin PilA